MNHFLRHALVGAVALMGATAAHAQVELERFERQLERLRLDTQVVVDQDIPADQRMFIDFGAYVSFNFLAIDDLNQETHILRQTTGNVYGRINIDGVHEAFARIRSTYNDFNSGDSFDGSGDDWVEPTLERGIYRFNLARALSAYEGKEVPWNVVIKGGRDLVHWANGLVMSTELDGAVVDLSYEDIALQIVAGRTRNSIADIDSSRPDFDGNTKRNFFGGMLSYAVTPRHRPYVYGLVQVDDNDDDVLTVGATSTRFDYDSFYIGGGSAGALSDQLLYTVEMTYQGGEALSNSFDNVTFAPVTQTREDIHAFAFDVRLDYLLGDENRSRLSGEVLLATGDDDRLTTTNTFGGNQTGTDDNAFNAFGYINTGLAFNPSVSNLLMLRLGASTYPIQEHELFRQFQVGVDAFVFGKLDKDAPIDEATTADHFLGTELDFFATWQVTSDVTLAMRYGVFFPDKAIVADDDPRHFFFTGVTLGF